MNFKHVFLFIALLFIPFVGCKKDLPEPEAVPSFNAEEAIHHLASQKEKDFFSKSFLTQNNPYIKPGLKERNDKALIDNVYNFMLKRHLETGFITPLLESNGYPIWNYAEVAHDSEGKKNNGVLIPFAKVDEDFVNAYVVAVPHNDWDATEEEWLLHIVERSEIDLWIQQYSPDSNTELKYHVFSFLYFNELLFETSIPEYENWMSSLIGNGDEEDITNRLHGSIFVSLGNDL